MADAGDSSGKKSKDVSSEPLIARIPLEVPSKSGTARDTKVSEMLDPHDPLTIATHANQRELARAEQKKAGDDQAKETKEQLSPEALIAKADRALRGGRFYDAVSLSTAAIDRAPTNVDAYLNRADARLKLGFSKEALDDGNQAIKLNKNNDESYTIRAAVYSDLSSKQQALKDFDRALELSPTWAGALSGRASIKAELGDKAGAIEDYTKAIALEPNQPSYYLGRGYRYIEMGEYQKGLDDTNQAIKLKTAENPDSSSVSEELNNRGMAYVGLGRYDEAMKDYQACLGEHGTNDPLEIHRNILALHEKRGDKPAADQVKKEIEEKQKEQVRRDQRKLEAFDYIVNVATGGKISDEVRHECSRMTFRWDDDAAEFERYANASPKFKEKRYSANFGTIVPLIYNGRTAGQDRVLRIKGSDGQIIDDLHFSFDRLRSE